MCSDMEFGTVSVCSWNLTWGIYLMFVIVLLPYDGLIFPGFANILRCLSDLTCFTDICMLYSPVTLYRPVGVGVFYNCRLTLLLSVGTSGALL
jgi:hypothetical protein